MGDASDAWQAQSAAFLEHAMKTRTAAAPMENRSRVGHKLLDERTQEDLNHMVLALQRRERNPMAEAGRYQEFEMNDGDMFFEEVAR